MIKITDAKYSLNLNILKAEALFGKQSIMSITARVMIPLNPTHVKVTKLSKHAYDIISSNKPNSSALSEHNINTTKHLIDTAISKILLNTP